MSEPLDSAPDEADDATVDEALEDDAAKEDLTPDEIGDEILYLLQLTEDDLAENRAGHLSLRQRRRIWWSEWSMLLFLVAVGFVVLGFAAAGAVKPGSSDVGRMFIWVIGLAPLALATFRAWGLRRGVPDDVLLMTGTITLRVEKGSTMLSVTADGEHLDARARRHQRAFGSYELLVSGPGKRPSEWRPLIEGHRFDVYLGGAELTQLYVVAVEPTRADAEHIEEAV